MTNYYWETDDLVLDFDTSPLGAISLESDAINRAVELSNRVTDREHQWQTYLNALALFGFESWLEERDSNLTVNSEGCSIQQGRYAHFVDGVFNLTVGEFKVCLLTNGIGIDDVVSIPRIVLDLPKYAAHFYIVVNVIEERSEVVIDRFIRYDELLQRQSSGDLIADADWTYEVPLSWFNDEPNDLLLSLRCLAPSAIALPNPTVETDWNSIQDRLAAKIPQLESSQPLHSILSWEEGAAIFNHSNLIDWLYEVRSGNGAIATWSEFSDRVSATIQGVSQRIINVRSWLSNELDELSQSLAWTLLPAPAFATVEFRDLKVIDRTNPSEEFTTIITQLRNSGEEITPQARGAYQDFTLGDRNLRLFMATWAIAETENIPEWSLLIVLGAQPNHYLPQGLKLSVSEGETVLDEKEVEQDTDDSYVYTRVIGELDEQFSVSISLTDGTAITFPSFAFV
ncbi:MAG: hypothetical protein Tsb0014_39920 [Pleurocapsa sp.]